VQSIWTDDISDFDNPNSQIGFHEIEGPDRQAMDAETPLDCLQLFFKDEILTSIIEQTNLYNQQQNNGNDNAKWKDITIEELKAFLGILLAMGLVELPKSHDYWARNTLISVPWFGSVMPRDRFFQILGYLHLSNNEEAPPRGDPNYKL